MCRNITELRGLEPSATSEEIEAAARQYVRKVSGIQKLSDSTASRSRPPCEVTASTRRLLAALPPRKQPPVTVPPLRRPEVRARITARSGG